MNFISGHRGSIVMLAKGHTPTASLFLIALVLTGCQTVAKGISKAVIIEYEQSLNFREYEISTETTAPPNSSASWKVIASHSGDTGPYSKGAWLMFQVCSVQNDSAKAEVFDYDVSKFYVVYEDQKHYYNALEPWTYSNGWNGYPGTPSATEILAPIFREETQTSPNQQSIGPNPTQTLSISWRFAIYVKKMASINDVDKQNLQLYYDGTPVVMINRNYDAVVATGVVNKDSLPIVCRPKK